MTSSPENTDTPDTPEEDTSGVATPPTDEQASANGPITEDTEKGTGDDVEPDTTSGGAPDQPE